MQEEKEQAAARLLKVQKKRKEDEEALTKLARLESLKERLSRVEEEQTRKKILEDKRKELEEQEKKLARELSRAEQEKTLAQEERDQAEKAYRKNLAHILARDLKEGQPCPVCGSIHHESPVSFAMDQDDPEERRARAEKVFQQIAGNITRLNTLLENNRQQERARKEEESRLNQEFLGMDLEKEKINFSAREQEREILTERAEREKKTEQELQDRILGLEKSAAGKKARKKVLGWKQTESKKSWTGWRRKSGNWRKALKVCLRIFQKRIFRKFIRNSRRKISAENNIRNILRK